MIKKIIVGDKYNNREGNKYLTFLFLISKSIYLYNELKEFIKQRQNQSIKGQTNKQNQSLK